jgi:hypothetical protein
MLRALSVGQPTTRTRSRRDSGSRGSSAAAVPQEERRILPVVATHTASCDSATVAEAGVCSGS